MQTLNDALNNVFVNIAPVPDPVLYINVFHPINTLFCNACADGNFKEARQIYEYYPEIDISFDNERAFRYACTHGHLPIAQWLLQLKPDIYISVYNEYPFSGACANGHLQIAEWLLSINPDINIRVNSDEAFRDACVNGHLHIAQWLYKKNPSINISNNNDWTFRWTCFNGYLPVARWLQSLKPYVYDLRVDAKGRVFDRVLSKEEAKEARWQHIKYAVWAASDKSPCRDSLLFKIPFDVTKRIIGQYL